jgi:hypothetical protein
VTTDIAISPAVHVTSDVEDQPSCRSSLPGVTAAFEFLPPGCSRAVRDDCTTMRATIAARDPLPLDVPLYECTVFPSPVLDPGSYAIACLAATAADPTGAAVAISCQSASIQVLPYECPPTPTPIATDATPAGSPTGVRATRTFPGSAFATATRTRVAGDDDGCQVAPAGAGAVVPLFGPALLLAWRRRRARAGTG